jgi:hypothetical protein
MIPKTAITEWSEFVSWRDEVFFFEKKELFG